MDASEAAQVLGVAPDASPHEIHRAWRLWAREVHPDVGGDREHFERIQQARRVLLARPGRRRGWPEPDHADACATPRPSLRTVLRRPGHICGLIATAIVTVALGALPRVFAPWPLVLTLMPAALGAAVWAYLAQRSVLVPSADHGHRIAVLTMLWAPIWIAQIVLGASLGTNPLAVLPLTAVPFAAAIAGLNAGAGLWRPVTRPDSQ